MGDTSPLGEVDYGPYFAMARAVVTGAPVPPAPTPSLPGRRTFVTMWSASRAHLVGTGCADTLMASVEAAARAIGEQAQDGARLQIDFLSGAEPIVITDQTTESFGELGRHGFLAASEPAHVGFVLPGEIVAFRYFDTRHLPPRLARNRLANALASRAGVEARALAQMPTYRIATVSLIESEGSGAPEPLFRARPPHPAALSPAELVQAVRSGADYLVNALDDQGRFQYFYRPAEDTAGDSYGILRHAGSTYALLEAYGETRDPRYLQKAELALRFLNIFYRESPGGSYLSDGVDEQQKVGGSGLALVALAKHAELTGQRVNLGRMQSLGRFIVHQQYPDGHFRANEDVAREEAAARDGPLAREVFYFPGEATLGLLRLYGIDRASQWLAAAQKAAHFLVVERDGPADEEQQIPDHWLSYALLDLYRETKEQVYADHAFKIARAVVKKETVGDNLPAPDYVGTFYPQGETTPTSTRLEALAADLELARFAGLSGHWLEGPAMRMASFMRAQQYDADNGFFVANLARARGGVRESLLVNDIRIDYVQHAMCAWLHLARVLRDPDYGKVADVRAAKGKGE